MAQMIFNPGDYTTQKAKPLPIILMLDTSGSMDIVMNPDEVRRTGQIDIVDGRRVEYVEGGITRISVLNEAVRKMVRTFAKYERDATEFLVAIITFGADTRLALPPSPAGDVRYTDLEASGNTPLKEAIGIAKKLIDDRNIIPSRSYRPLIVLVSDGEPDAGWEGDFSDFIQNGRTAKCDRMAMAIGKEANREMLKRFVEGTGHEVFEADAPERITEFFKFVTMSSVQRSLSMNPNEVPKDGTVTQPGPPPEPIRKPEGTENSPSESPADTKDDDDDDEGYW